LKHGDILKHVARWRYPGKGAAAAHRREHFVRLNLELPIIVDPRDFQNWERPPYRVDALDLLSYGRRQDGHLWLTVEEDARLDDIDGIACAADGVARSVQKQALLHSQPGFAAETESYGAAVRAAYGADIESLTGPPDIADPSDQYPPQLRQLVAEAQGKLVLALELDELPNATDADRAERWLAVRECRHRITIILGRAQVAKAARLGGGRGERAVDALSRILREIVRLDRNIGGEKVWTKLHALRVPHLPGEPLLPGRIVNVGKLLGATPAPPVHRNGWPKTLPCLFCERPHLATSPGDRLHPRCRERAEHGGGGTTETTTPETTTIVISTIPGVGKKKRDQLMKRVRTGDGADRLQVVVWINDRRRTQVTTKKEVVAHRLPRVRKALGIRLRRPRRQRSG
jgi:hypothetical protein